MKTVTQQQQAASQYNGVAEKRVDFGYDLDGDVSSVTRYAGLNDTSPVVATSSYAYLCPGQVGGADFVRPLGEPGSKGVGRFSFSHKSMAA